MMKSRSVVQRTWSCRESVGLEAQPRLAAVGKKFAADAFRGRIQTFMSMPAELTQEPPLGDVEVTTSDVERVERALIDASTRLPVLVFYTSAIAWLLLATLLAGF